MPSSSFTADQQQLIGRKIVFAGVSLAAIVSACAWLFYRRPRDDDDENPDNTDDMQRGGRVDFRAAQRKEAVAAALKKQQQEESCSNTSTETKQTKQMVTSTDQQVRNGPFQGGSWSEEVERQQERQLREQRAKVYHTQPYQPYGQQAHQPISNSKVTPAMSSTTGYTSVDSPCASDLHSEASQDSGRGGSTSGLGCGGSMSPVEEMEPMIEVTPSYEFEIPQSLVGLVIGIKGKTIQELQTRSNCKMIIRKQHHLGRENFQVCTVEGKRDDINRCLQLLRRKFPLSRFPELNLKPLLPPPIPSPTAQLTQVACSFQPHSEDDAEEGTQATQLSLAEGIRNEVALSSIQDPGHFFLQQPTHPTFPCLNRLDQYMMLIYSQPQGHIPDLPKPVEMGILCAAPALGGWYRAVTSMYYPESDEVLVKFVDYGGYSRLPCSDLKQIRSDFIWLQFQAVECYLAGIVPIDEQEGWSSEASQVFDQLCGRSVIEALIVGTAEDGTALIELYALNERGKQIRVSEELVDLGFARWSAEN